MLLTDDVAIMDACLMLYSGRSCSVWVRVAVRFRPRQENSEDRKRPGNHILTRCIILSYYFESSKAVVMVDLAEEAVGITRAGILGSKPCMPTANLVQRMIGVPP
jgi:hypothetical protein